MVMIAKCLKAILSAGPGFSCTYASLIVYDYQHFHALSFNFSDREEVFFTVFSIMFYHQLPMVSHYCTLQTCAFIFIYLFKYIIDFCLERTQHKQQTRSHWNRHRWMRWRVCSSSLRERKRNNDDCFKNSWKRKKRSRDVYCRSSLRRKRKNKGNCSRNS